MKQSTIITLSLFALMLTACTSEETSPTETNSTKNDKAITGLEQVSMPTSDALQKDPDIIWLGEVMVDYALDYNKYLAKAEDRTFMESIGFKTRNDFKILKLQVNDLNESTNDDHVLIHKLLKNIESFKIYQDADLTMPYSLNEAKRIISSVDTVITFDPESKEEKQVVVVNELDPFNIKFFRVKHWIYYSRKDMIFKTVALSVAPMHCNYANDGTYKDVTPLFWMKPAFAINGPQLNAENITWAKRMYRNFPLESVKVIKQEYAIEAVMDTMLADFRKNYETVVLGHVFDADGNLKFNANEVKNLGASLDTIITFDPKTFQQSVQVVENKMNGKSFEQLRLMQDWIWDDKNKELYIRYVGFKPIINRYDVAGNFLNSGPSFTRKVED